MTLKFFHLIKVLNKEHFYGKSWRKCAPKDFFNSHYMQEILSKIKYSQRGLLKTLKKLTLLNPQCGYIKIDAYLLLRTKSCVT